MVSNFQYAVNACNSDEGLQQIHNRLCAINTYYPSVKVIHFLPVKGCSVNVGHVTPSPPLDFPIYVTSTLLLGRPRRRDTRATLRWITAHDASVFTTIPLGLHEFSSV